MKKIVLAAVMALTMGAAMADGTTVWLAQFGEIYTGSSLGTFDASIVTGNVNLLFTPTNSSTTVKLMRRSIVV